MNTQQKNDGGQAQWRKAALGAQVRALLPDPDVRLAGDDNLISLGLDSLSVMRLASGWRRAGAAVTFADLITEPTLNAWWRLLLPVAAPGVVEAPAASAAVVTGSGTDGQPFALTDVQHAYWIGRQDGQALGGVGCHAYLELDGDGVDAHRLEVAWHRLLAHHAMLRTCFTEDGQQRTEGFVSRPTLPVHNLRGQSPAAVEAALADIRQHLSHRRLAVERGEVMGMTLSLLDAGRTRLHFDIDLLVADVQSLQIILRDLAAAYAREARPAANPDWRFGPYLAQENACRQAEGQDAGTYWQRRLATLPGAPGLPLRTEKLAVPRFSRREHRLSPACWQALRRHAAAHRVTPAMLLLTAYAEVLACWSSTPRFLVNVPLFDRQAGQPGIDEVVADFTNLLLLEVDFSAPQSFLARVRQIQAQAHADIAHAAYSGVRIQRDLARQGQGGGVAAPVVFACNLGTPLINAECRSTLGQLGYMISQTPQVWLDHQVYDLDGGVLLAWDAVDALFPDGVLDAMFAAYVGLLDWLVQQDGAWEQLAPALLPPTQAAARQAANATRRELGERVLHAEVFARAALQPERVALIAGDGTVLSHGELARRALQVAAWLMAKGLTPGMPVAVSLPRGVEQVVAVLGILAAGGCYVPIGIGQPASRQARMHRAAGVKLVLCSRTHWPQLTADSEVARLDIAAAADCVPLARPVDASAQQTAYVIFTSGSTGEPKGVEIAHRAAANTVVDINARYGVDADSRALAVSALDFDLSVYDLFGVLGAGGSLVLVDEAHSRDAAAWLEQVKRYDVTLWNSVPVLLDMLLTVAGAEQRLPLRQVLLSGDWIGLDLPRRLRDACGGEARLIALGGATEASIWSNAFEVKGELPAHWTSIPYGRPLANQQYRVVDAQGRDCPDWVAGELWIGGTGVAQGYCNEPALTAQRFVSHDGERWYRTGDRGRYWSDGTLEFLGRQDHQVKVRGHRIELGEIETAMTAQAGVAQAVVVTVGQPAVLAAAVVPASSPAESETFLTALRQQLGQVLPDFMIPALLLMLDALPLSANGKVDRQQIRQQLEARRHGGALPLTPPQGEREQQVASLWQSLLQLERVGREQSFFALGGDSLLATQVIARLKQMGLGSAQGLRMLYARPVLADFAAQLKPIATETERVIVAELQQRHAPFPLTEVQRAYWLGQSTGLPLSCGTHYLVELDGHEVDLTRLEWAWNQLVLRHEMLRAVVDEDGRQRILATVPQTEIQTQEIEQGGAAQAQACLHLCWESQSRQRSDWPLFSLHAVRYDGERCRIGLFFDYMMLDGFSIKLLLDQLTALYRDPRIIIAAPDLSFRDYVNQARPEPEALARAEAYWRGRLEALPLAPVLPLARDPQSLAEVRFQRRQTVLPAAHWRRLRQRARAQDITPSVLLLTVYAHVLCRWSGGAAHTLNLTLFDRQPVHPDIDRVLGDFTSLAPVAFHPRADASLLQQARNTQHEIAAAMEHREISSLWIQRERSRQTDLVSAALPVVFTSMLGPEGRLFEHAEAGQLELVAGGGLSETPQVWLDHQLYEHRGELVLTWDAVDALFPEGVLDQMFAAYREALLQLPDSDWDGPLALPLPAAQAAVRQMANATRREQRERLLHDDIFTEALRQPERVALIAGDGAVLSRGELARRALQVAAGLVAQGVMPGTPVAVSLPRGVEQVVAVLGILAAGGCYVPIGIGQPGSRQARMHRTAGVKLVLCSRVHWSHLLSENDAEHPVALLDIVEAGDCTPLAAPVVVSAQQPAYIIFTSGSTGEPKGVEITHQAAINTVDDINARYGVDADSRGLAVSALDFDLSVYDLFGVLGAGGSLVLVDEAHSRDAAAWLVQVKRYDVTLWNSVPVLLDMLLTAAGAEQSLSLRQVLLSGDWIGLDLPRRLQAACRGKAQLVALGGATEVSIWSNAFEVKGELPAHWTSIPYGRPLANQQYRVVDAQGRDCPDWVAGELWIGGSGVATGYRRAPELTAQRFVSHGGERWYRTGDRGRYWSDGTLEFLGRQDHQVKVGGHRIELGEIEAALTAQAGVAHAVAVTLGQPAVLAAAVVPVSLPVGSDAYLAALRQQLSLSLPDYMMPALLLTLDALPLSANGKVDRQQIRQQLEARRHGGALPLTPPQGEREQQVASLWQSLLQLERVGREQSFFALGGDSLLATQVMAHLKQMGLGSPQGLRMLYARPVLADFAAQLEPIATETERVIVAELQQRHAPFPLTEVQRAYWLGQSTGLPLSCGTHYLLELDGREMDLTRLERAWDQLVLRHEMLRAVVDEDGMQRVLEQVPSVRVTREQTEAANEADAQRRLLQVWELRSTNLVHWPLFSLHAVHYGDRRCRLGLMFNYMALDGYSVKLLLNELSVLYRDPATALPPVGIAFRDYVNQVRPEPEALERAEAYWRERLEALPLAPALPLARDPQTLPEVRFQRRSARVAAQAWQRLREQARRHGITPSVLVLTVYAHTLSRWSGGAALTLNLTRFDRQPVHPDIDRVLGDFTSLAPVAFHPHAEASLLHQARTMQSEIAEALEYREVSSVWVQRERGKRVGIAAAALPVVFTSTLGIADSLFDEALPAGFPDLAGGGLSETPQVWLDHQMYEHRGELLFSWDVVEDLFPPGMMDSLFGAFVQLLAQLPDSDWDAPLVPLLPAAQAAARRAANATRHEQRERLLHDDIFTQAQRQPERVALIAGDGAVLSRGELARRALQVAAWLVAQGVTPGMPVAVSLPRGMEQVVAVLGILAAGGCYVPIGIGQPGSRQARMYRTAGVKLVLCSRAHWPLLPSANDAGHPVALLDIVEAGDCTPLAAPVGVSAQQTAYIIFTSGSTGEPKGVEIAHRAAANTIDDINTRYGVDADSRGLAVSALDFDLSVYDLFGVLGAGGSLVLVDEVHSRDAAAWLEQVMRYGVTLWNSVPVLLDMLLTAAGPEARSLPLRQVLLSGDWIGLDLPRRLQAACGNEARLVALGEATEASIWSNAFEVEGELPAHWTSIPYGRPLANQQYRVVDAQGRDCPDWVAGELWIGGTGLAQGYRNEPELTAQRFVSHDGERWYRTGDRGRYWPDGTLEFLGREDHQVKVRGHRIELGEIETALTAQAGVVQAVAVTVGQPGVLAAAVVPALPPAEPDTFLAALRQQLGQALPDYMVPALLLTLDTLPLSANGKVDRGQIRQRLEQGADAEIHYQPPLDALEAEIAAVWTTVLLRERVSRDDDFFAIGGDSLSATRIVALLQQGRLAAEPVTLRLLFSYPSIAALAAQIRGQWQALGVSEGGDLIFEEGAL